MESAGPRSPKLFPLSNATRIGLSNANTNIHFRADNPIRKLSATIAVSRRGARMVRLRGCENACFAQAKLCQFKKRAGWLFTIPPKLRTDLKPDLRQI